MNGIAKHALRFAFFCVGATVVLLLAWRVAIWRSEKQLDRPEITIVMAEREPKPWWWMLLLGNDRRSHIRSVVVSDVPLSPAEIRYIDSLPQLESLALSNCPNADVVLRSYENAGKLTRLYVRGLEGQHDTFHRFVRSRSLKYLVIDVGPANHCDLAFIETLSSLNELSLEGKAVTDASLPRLSECHQLHRLSLWNVEVSDNCLSEIAKVDSLVTLEICIAELTGKTLSAIRGLSQLRYLDLSGNAIKADSLSALGDMTTLRDIVLPPPLSSSDEAMELQRALPLCEIRGGY